MRRWMAAAVAAAVLGTGCGPGGGSLPPAGLPPGTGATGDGGGGGDDGGGGGPTQPGDTRLWPLTTGSTWTYTITDPDAAAPFQKKVTVLGPQSVPGSGGTATVVVSEQPTLTEKSWQVERDGLVLRVREEDRRSGFLIRTQTWAAPSGEPIPTVKALAAAPADAGWTHSLQVVEVTVLADGTEERKDKQYTWRILSLAEEVTVPAGTFTALKVQRDRTDKEGKPRVYWLAPGVGKVREEGERTEELVSYEVKKP